MGRFVIEHLPRKPAKYDVRPLNQAETTRWLRASPATSLIRTVEMISAIKEGLGVALRQSKTRVTLRPGDEALLIGLSYGVLLAWAEGKIPPLPEDWRCLLLTVEAPGAGMPLPVALTEELPGFTQSDN